MNNYQMLRKWAKYLETEVTDAQWDMSVYWKETECGTVGCAGGHAADCFPEHFVRVTGRGVGCIYTNDRSLDRYEAIANVFKITKLQALSITGEPYAVSRFEIANRIREIAKKYKPEPVI